jgi:hypothetical protein
VNAARSLISSLPLVGRVGRKGRVGVRHRVVALFTPIRLACARLSSLKKVHWTFLPASLSLLDPTRGKEEGKP